MLSSVRDCVLQHTRLGSFLPALLLVLLLPVMSACNSSSGFDDSAASTGSANPVTVTAGEGSVTVDSGSGGSARSSAQEACTYNVYNASEPGVTSENYSTLADGEATREGEEVSVMPTASAGSDSGDAGGMTPSSNGQSDSPPEVPGSSDGGIRIWLRDFDVGLEHERGDNSEAGMTLGRLNFQTANKITLLPALHNYLRKIGDL